MSFKTNLANDAVYTFLNSNEHAEDITYTPYGGSAKSIKAVVERRRLAPAGEDSGRILANQVEIYIANNATHGVATINKGQDTVSLPERLGSADVTWVVTDILDQDGGLWRLLLNH